MTLKELTEHTVREFTKMYGRQPRWIVAAPGRVNIIGEHTDYNDGYVLPMAIELYTVIAADRPAQETNQIRLYSTLGDKPATVDLTKPLKPLPKGTWANYPIGVIAAFLDRGLNPGGFDAMIHSTVPFGGGLSSSAALEVATATLLESITGKKLDLVEKALLCQKAEHEYAGMPCGIMDQFISIMGRENHVLLLDCRSRKTELVPMSDPSINVLIINTNVRHQLTGSEYPMRRKQCETAAKILGVPSLRDATKDLLKRTKGRMNKDVYHRARHVIGEIERTKQAAEDIRAADWAAVGKLMYASHRSLRNDYEVSCKALDTVVEIAKSIGPKGGMIGCRMTGAGFGGCAVALVKTDAIESISKKLAADYKKKTGIEATIFVSRPAAGATVIKNNGPSSSSVRPSSVAVRMSSCSRLSAVAY
jgi:galactokinase